VRTVFHMQPSRRGHSGAVHSLFDFCPFTAGSTASNSRCEDQHSTESRKKGRRKRTAGRRRNGTDDDGDADWGRRVGGEREPDEGYAPKSRRGSWQGDVRNTKGRGPRTEPGGTRRRSRGSLGSPSAKFGGESSRERLLWDELRESLHVVAGRVEAPGLDTLDRRGAVEKANGDRAREERRRRLIEEAIAVLLEGSSGSSDDERLGDEGI